MALVTTCAGVTIPVQLDTLTCEEKIDDTSTSTAFTVIDGAGYSLSQYQVVQITDTATSLLLYAGYIDNVSDTPLGPGNTAILMRVVTCKDSRWLADKGTWVGPEFNGWLAGDVAAEIHRVSLAAEGVTASYALRHDMDAASFGAGTLNGTAVVNGALTLALSGADFTQSETTTANFNTGTLTNVIGANGGLNLTSYSAIKYTGTAGANLNNNALFAYRKIWAGSYTLVAGDLIYVDQWISSASPEIKAGIDIQFSDGTWMSDAAIFTNFQDQWVIPLAPSGDLSGYADDQWMTRACTVQAASAGKVVVAIYLSIQGQAGGDYTCYFKNIKITSSTGVVRVSAFLVTDSAMHANVPGGSSGYFNLAASVVTVYAHDGNRVSPSRSITTVGVVKGSVISWIERDAVQPTAGRGSAYLPQVAVLASYDDGATWLPCTNHAPLPGLPLGMNASGRTITIWQQLAVGGCSPELAPFLDTCTFTVFSAPQAVKTDYFDIDNSVALMGGGVLTNCTSYAGGVMTTGQYRAWNVTGTDATVAYANQTLYGLSGAGNPAQGEAQNYFFMRTDSGLDVRSRFDFAGAGWADFIAEIDIHFISNTGGSEYGFVYRTTGWSNNNNTYAYAAELSTNHIILNRAANGGTPAFTTLQTVTLSLTVGAWYRMKVVAVGSSHKVYINDVLYINWTDSTYLAAGYVGVRFWNSTGVRDSAHFNNFGIIAYDASLQSISTRTTAALPLALTAPIGSSVLNWEASVPSSSNLLVESTIDNGANWNTCTNGGPIPLLVPGFVPGGASLKVRYTMTNQAIGLPITLTGHSVIIVSQYAASGTRVSPALALDAAGTVGSSGVTYTANTPAGTGAAVATSTDNITYTNVAASGNPIAGLVAMGPMTFDDFITNTAANYAGVFWAGGAPPVFSMNTGLSRMEVTAGANAILLWNTAQFPSAKDVDVEVITNQADAGGLVWRYTSVDNNYYVTLKDNTSGTNPNTLSLRKRVAATDTQLVAPTALPVTFTRGTTYHTLKVTMVGQVITAYFDGIVVFTTSDASLAGPGQVGLRQSSATASYWYSLRAQQLGQSAIGAKAYTKTTLTSSDPTQNPVMSQLVTSVRGPDLMSGVLINATNYQYKNTPAACLSDVAQQSKFYWKIDKNKKLLMKDRAYSPAPWPLYSTDPLLMISSSYPQAIRQSPLYRNRQYVYNCIDIQSVPELKTGDGNIQSWPLSYPVDSIVSLSMDGNPQTWGVQSVDTGRNFYYKQGTNVLAADASLFPEFGAAITLTYMAQVPYTAMKENTAQQAIIAAIDSTSGIISSAIDGQGITRAAGDVLAQANIDAYANLSVDWEFFTRRAGLAAGHYISVFVPEYGLNDLDMLITDIVTKPWMDGTGTINYDYDVKATSGPNQGSWQKIFA